MALTSAVLTSSTAWTSGGVLLKAVEVTPDGGSLEIRVLQGTDTTGTELYRIRAQERSEFRVFPEGLQFTGPLYIYFYEGTGVLVAMS